MLKPTYEPDIWAEVERLRAEMQRLEAEAEVRRLQGECVDLSCEREARAYRAGQEAMTLDAIEVPVFKRDLGAMLISAVRYALGRMSYIAGPTCTWVMTYWTSIPDEDASMLLSELRHWVHIQDSATPGYRVGVDLVEWRNLLEWMEENYVAE